MISQNINFTGIKPDCLNSIGLPRLVLMTLAVKRTAAAKIHFTLRIGDRSLANLPIRLKQSPGKVFLYSKGLKKKLRANIADCKILDQSL